MLPGPEDLLGGILFIALSDSTRNGGWLIQVLRTEIKHFSRNLFQQWISGSVVYTPAFEDAKRIR